MGRKVERREIGMREVGKGDKERLDTFFVSFLSSVAGEAFFGSEGRPKGA